MLTCHTLKETALFLADHYYLLAYLARYNPKHTLSICTAAHPENLSGNQNTAVAARTVMSQFRDSVNEDTVCNTHGLSTLGGTRADAVTVPWDSSCAHLSECGNSHLSVQTVRCTVSRSREHCHSRCGPHRLLRYRVSVLPCRHVVADWLQRLLLILRPPLRCGQAPSQRP